MTDTDKRQTIYGLRGATGLEHEVQSLQREVEKLKTFRTRVITLFAAVQAALLVSVQVLIAWLKVNK